MELHLSQNVPVFEKAKEIIDNGERFSVEHIVSVIEELTLFEEEVRNIRQQIFEVTYHNVMRSLIAPIDGYFESEYEEN
jgi:hypothetical protein